MKIFLVAGEVSWEIKNKLEENEIYNVVRIERSLDEAYYFLENNSIDFDYLLLLDYGINIQIEKMKNIFQQITTLLENQKKQLIFISNEDSFQEFAIEVSRNSENVKLISLDKIKIPVEFIFNALEKIHVSKELGNQGNGKKEKSEKWKFFGNGAKKKKIIETKSNKVIGITGHSGSGISSTAANIAELASKNGLKTLIVDLNLDNKGQNLYFEKFGEEIEKEEDLKMSVIKCFYNPENYAENTCRINDKLYLAGLGYTLAKNEKTLDVINSVKLANLITILKLKFNLIILDIPLNLLKSMDKAIIYFDKFGVCVNNNMHSIINTIMELETFDKQFIDVFWTKANLINTKYNKNSEYNGKEFSESLVKEIIISLGQDLSSEIQNIGKISHSNNFEIQYDRGKKMYGVSTEFYNEYMDILNKFID
jgi:Mrp family chromosome partitioning ATPase